MWLQVVFGVDEGCRRHDRGVDRVSGEVFEGIGSALPPVMAVLRLKKAWLGLATRLSRLQPMVRQDGLCLLRLGSQRRYPLPRPEQQLVRRMAARQPDHQPPGTPRHPSRKGDQREAYCLQTAAHPLTS